MKRIWSLLGLRDPIWQGVGAIFAVIGLVLSVAVAYDIYQKSNSATELSLTKRFYFNPLQFGDEVEGKVEVIINGVAIKSVLRVDYYSLSNTGNNAVRPEDYIKPIQVSVEEPWELISVIPGSTTPSNLEIDWTKVSTSTFQMAPILLNPQDTVELLLFLTQAQPYKAEEKTEPKINWNTRIVNVQALKEGPAPGSDPSFLSVSIYHYGWRVYALIGLALITFGLSTWGGVRSRRLDCLSISRILLLVLLAGFAFATAEIVVDTLVGGYLAPVEWGIILLHLILLAYLLWPLVHRRFMQRQIS